MRVLTDRGQYVGDVDHDPRRGHVLHLMELQPVPLVCSKDDGSLTIPMPTMIKLTMDEWRHENGRREIALRVADADVDRLKNAHGFVPRLKETA